MNERQELMFLAVLVILLMILSIGVGYTARHKIGSTIRSIRARDVISPEECVNLTMEDTAYCLNDYVRTIYKFKYRQDWENPTLAELIEEGGDCKNWAELYMGYIDDLGFYTERPSIQNTKEAGHTFAVISDETGYCILDQRKIFCVYLDFSSLENETKNYINNS